MTLLDWFAGQVINGAMAGVIITKNGVPVSDVERFTTNAYEIAEAMIAERNKRMGSA